MWLSTLAQRATVRRRGEIPSEAYTTSILLKLRVIEALLDRDGASPRIVYNIMVIGVGRKDFISLVDHYTVDWQMRN
jgi:hypothetical protein